MTGAFSNTSTAGATTSKLNVEIVEHTALITIDNPSANTWDYESLSGLKALVEEPEAFVDLCATEDQAEGVQAFLEKRAPVWKNP